jgi:adenosine deaminase
VTFNVQSVINREGDLWKALWAWPKIELHRHLEGSIRLETMIEVAREHDIPLPASDPEHLRPYVQMTDDDEANFAVFLSKFNVLRQFYRSADIIKRITREAVEDAAKDNIKYMELRFTPHALTRQNNYHYEDVIGCVCEAAMDAQSKNDIMVRLIVSMNRHESVQIAERVVEAALQFSDCGMVGIDLAGLEVGHSARPFRTVFQKAHAGGLQITVHAGEWEGAANVAEAVEVVGAVRIGHGVRSVEDSQVIQLLREKQITLEVCPTSNLHSGVVGRLEMHPLVDLNYLGVPTTINTDDPSLSAITLTDELVMAHVGMGMTFSAIKRNILNAAQAAFLPDDERTALIAKFDADLEKAPNP